MACSVAVQDLLSRRSPFSWSFSRCDGLHAVVKLDHCKMAWMVPESFASFTCTTRSSQLGFSWGSPVIQHWQLSGLAADPQLCPKLGDTRNSMLMKPAPSPFKHNWKACWLVDILHSFGTTGDHNFWRLSGHGFRDSLSLVGHCTDIALSGRSGTLQAYSHISTYSLYWPDFHFLAHFLQPQHSSNAYTMLGPFYVAGKSHEQ